MRLAPEIKDFLRRVMILAGILSLFLHLLFSYIGSFAFSAPSVNANGMSNDARFARKNIDYIGISGVAVSYNIGTARVIRDAVPVNLTDTAVEISHVLADKGTARQKLLSAHMVNIASYVNLLKTDVPALLDRSNDRDAMLESFTDQLTYRQKKTQDLLATLASQGRELQAAVAKTDQQTEAIKTDLENAYKKYDYDRTETLIDSYLRDKQENTYAHTYLIFIARFIDSYKTLNTYSKQLSDTIAPNRDALVKRATVTVKNTDILQKLQLLQSEARSHLSQ